MPCYPALALLIGSAMDAGGKWIQWGTHALSLLSAMVALAVVAILISVRHVPAQGDISAALSSHPQVYSLSLGHLEDLTLASFAYLRAPLAVAGLAFLLGAIGTIKSTGKPAYVSITLMMVVFFQGARLAMAKFDPLLSSREMAERILQAAPGQIIVDHHYYTFSSIAFYTGRSELLLNGRWNNFEYGSNAPDAPNVYISDDGLKLLWFQPQQRYYLIARAEELPRFDNLLGRRNIGIMDKFGGKVLLTNGPLASH